MREPKLRQGGSDEQNVIQIPGHTYRLKIATHPTEGWPAVGIMQWFSESADPIQSFVRVFNPLSSILHPLSSLSSVTHLCAQHPLWQAKSHYTNGRGWLATNSADRLACFAVYGMAVACLGWLRRAGSIGKLP